MVRSCPLIADSPERRRIRAAFQTDLRRLRVQTSMETKGTEEDDEALLETTRRSIVCFLLLLDFSRAQFCGRINRICLFIHVCQ